MIPTPPYTSPQILPWYGVRVKSHCEQIASKALAARGYDPFLPSYQIRRRWSDRVKLMELPLFPGYLFCRLDVTQRLPVLTSPGVVDLVGIGKVPVAIDEAEVDAIRAVVGSGLAARPWPFVREGQRVQVEDGPLRGMQGIVTSIQDRRMIISVTLLQRSVSVAMDPAWIRSIQ